MAPAIFFYILQEGVDVIEEAIIAPFLALEPFATFKGSGDYPELPGWIGWGNAAATCQNSGLANTRFPIELQKYNATAQRCLHDLLSSTMNEVPALNQSIVLFEGYSQQGVNAIPSQHSAYPFRGSNILASPVVRFNEDGEELTRKAEILGEALRNILHKGEDSGQNIKRTYVNYAFGTESVEEMYGNELWRQVKLSALKGKYDPDGKFSFYAPIARKL
ncbi:hypothetical protein SLS60_001013 [Paraconiothyrium brasiliense]|uniref:Berberine/berberine-like domain-containing protein n=1 Tax=Paraconiothyrium brasiliense TaxID=300254 RepID=A0ABR3S7W1_9PLEO